MSNSKDLCHFKPSQDIYYVLAYETGSKKSAVKNEEHSVMKMERKKDWKNDNR